MTARTYDINGWFEVKDNPISREGVFPYSGAQIGAPDRDRIYAVYRPGDELSDPETLASFRLMPIIEDHTMLGDGFTPAENVGVEGVIGENVQFRNGVMTANLKIFSSALAEKIKSGKTELSCGYRCVYDFTPGVWNGTPYDAVQRRIRANHLALVDEGRMGPQVAILDHMVFTVDAKEPLAVDDELKKLLADLAARLKKVEGAMAEKVEVKSEVEDEETEVKAKAKDEETEVKAKAKDEETEVKAETKDEGAPKAEAMDSLLKQVKALTKEVQALKAKPAMDEKTVLDTLARKTALVDRLVPHIGTFDHARMTTQDVAKYGIQKLGIKNVPTGQEAVALDAYLQAKPVAAPYTAQDSARVTSLGKAIDTYATGKGA